MGNCCSQAYHDKHKPQVSEMHIKEFRKTYKSLDFPDNFAFTHDSGLYRMKSKLNNQSVMLKRLDFSIESDLSRFLRRLDKIIQLEHDNLLKIYNYAVEKNQLKDMTLCFTLNIAFESFEHTLQDELLFRSKANKSFTEKEIRNFLSDLVDLLQFLQLKDISLGSLQPLKIYLSPNKNAKLLYLGNAPVFLTSDQNLQNFSSTHHISRQLNQSAESGRHNCHVSNSECGSPKASQSFKKSVFSLGLILLEMMSVSHINRESSFYDSARQHYKAVESSGAYGPLIMNLVKTMIREDELVRPDFLELKKMILIEEYMDATLPKGSKKDRQLEINDIQKNESHENNCRIDVPHGNLDSCDVTGINLLEGMGEEYKTSKEDIGTPMIKLEDSRHEYETSPTEANGDNAEEERGRQRAFGEFLKKVEGKSSYEEIEIQTEAELTDVYNRKASNYNKLTITLEDVKGDNETIGRLSEIIERQRFLNELILELPHAEINAEQLVRICKGIQSLRQLSSCHIDFRGVSMTEKGLQAIGECLNSKPKLISLTLNLSDSMLTSQNCTEISTWFRKLTSLNSLALNLGGNEIGSAGIARIGKELSNMKELESIMIFLYETGVEGKEGVSAIFRGLAKLKKLKKISVNFVSNLLRDNEIGVIESFAKESKAEEIVINLKDNDVSEGLIKNIESEYVKRENIDFRF